jgi:hypothetical protein
LHRGAGSPNTSFSLRLESTTGVVHFEPQDTNHPEDLVEETVPSNADLYDAGRPYGGFRIGADAPANAYLSGQFSYEVNGFSGKCRVQATG